MTAYRGVEFTNADHIPINREGSRLYEELRVSDIEHALLDCFPRLESRYDEVHEIAKDIYRRSYDAGHANGNYEIEYAIDDNFDLVVRALEMIVGDSIR